MKKGANSLSQKHKAPGTSLLCQEQISCDRNKIVVREIFLWQEAISLDKTNFAILLIK
jgi:hypothetical protein